jgi:beta-lactamase class A
MIKFILTISLFTLFQYTLFAQVEHLKTPIENLLKNKQADVGVAVLDLEGEDFMSINGDSRYPLQSVYKFYIALAVLDAVDKEKFSLNQEIFISEKDLSPDVYSPLQEKYPRGNVYLPLSKIIEYTLCKSDNNGCDILIKLVGGTQVVEDYIHSLGINDFSIKANAVALREDWDLQFKNWTTPDAAVKALKTAFKEPILSKTSHKFFWRCLEEIQTGKNRLKGKLPKGTIVAHKTGSSGPNPEGITAAVNDIGIVTLPNGKHYAISVFISRSEENKVVNEGIIADISKIVWDYFVAKN